MRSGREAISKTSVQGTREVLVMRARIILDKQERVGVGIFSSGSNYAIVLIRLHATKLLGCAFWNDEDVRGLNGDVCEE